MSRDHKEDLERIQEICDNFDTISVKDADFVNDISHRQEELSEAQGKWLDDIWEKYLKS